MQLIIIVNPATLIDVSKKLYVTVTRKDVNVTKTEKDIDVEGNGQITIEISGDEIDYLTPGIARVQLRGALLNGVVWASSIGSIHIDEEDSIVEFNLDFPETILKIDEIKAIYDVEEKTGGILQEEIRNLDKDISIVTATERGIERREKILGIKHQDTDDLEDRRLNVLTKWNEEYPYTLKFLMNKLDKIVGNGNYTIAVDSEKLEMKCLVEMRSATLYGIFLETLEKIVPMNISIDVGLRYNQWINVAGLTYKDVETKTYYQIKTEVKE